MLRRAIIGAAMMKKLSELTVLTRGGRGVASGIAHKLHRKGVQGNFGKPGSKGGTGGA
jgi:hypothetical protein